MYNDLSLSVNVDSFPLFLFSDLILSWFVYVEKTLETVALNKPNNMTVVSENLQLTRNNDLFSFEIGQAPNFLILLHIHTVTQHNHYCIDTSTTECKQMEEHSALQTEVLSL
jgi:hypothetical protein